LTTTPELATLPRWFPDGKQIAYVSMQLGTLGKIAIIVAEGGTSPARIEVVVTLDGTVESTQLIGGDPILGQRVMRAIKQWKYSRAKARQT
jgi:Tol biopolymer transport system component